MGFSPTWVKLVVISGKMLITKPKLTLDKGADSTLRPHLLIIGQVFLAVIRQWHPVIYGAQ